MSRKEEYGLNGGPLGEFLETRKKLTPQETLEKLKRYKENPSIELRNEIVEDNLRLVVKYASSCAKQWHCPIEDLIQEGSLGLIRAVDDFDPSRNNAFSTLAMKYIQNSIYRYLTEFSRTIRLSGHTISKARRIANAEETLSSSLGRKPTDEEISAFLHNEIKTGDIPKIRQAVSTLVSLDSDVRKGDSESALSLGGMIPDLSEDPARVAMEKDRDEAVLKALSSLSETERDILVSRHQEHPVTLTELAKKYGVSPEAIRQRENKAEEKLKALLKDF